jgi:molybdate transport system ATP-binding protein
VNLVRGTVEADGVLRAADGRRWYGRPAEDVEVGAAGVALFAPSAVAVYRDEPHGSPRNVAAVTVAELDVAGPTIRVRSEVQADGSPGVAADVTAVAAADLDLGPGSPVWFVVKAQEIAIHAAHR